MRTLGALLLNDGQATTADSDSGGIATCLQSVANRPLAVHALQALARAGAERVVVAAEGEIAHSLRRALLDAAPAQLVLEFHELPAGGGALPAMVAACRMAVDDCLVVHAGDYLFCGDLGELASRMVDEELDAILLTDGAREDGGDGDGSSPAATDRRRFAGVHLLSNASAQLAVDLPSPGDLETTLQDLEARLAAGGGRVRTAEAQMAWRWTDTPDALLEANRLVLDRLDHQVPSSALVRSQVQGRASIDPTAKIEASLIRGPAVVGAGAHVLNSYIGPYSTIGDDVVLEGVEVEHSIVHAGSRVRHVGVRLESSVIGPSSVVERHFALPAAMQLAIGAGSCVWLS